MQTQVVELPRHGRPLYTGPMGAALKFIDGQARPAMPRLALVIDVPAPDVGADALACVPLTAFEDWADRAVDVVAAWDARWLLIDSMPARHRDECRDDLWRAVGAALVAAAMGGVDASGAPPDLPF